MFTLPTLIYEGRVGIIFLVAQTLFTLLFYRQRQCSLKFTGLQCVRLSPNCKHNIISLEVTDSDIIASYFRDIMLNAMLQTVLRGSGYVDLFKHTKSTCRTSVLHTEAPTADCTLLHRLTAIQWVSCNIPVHSLH